MPNRNLALTSWDGPQQTGETCPIDNLEEILIQGARRISAGQGDIRREASRRLAALGVSGILLQLAKGMGSRAGE